MKKEQFDRARASQDKGVLVHLVCNEADHIFYSDDPDQLSKAHRVVLCVETYFAAMCDGGFGAWFDGDHGQLACCCTGSLRAVDLHAHADVAERALKLHHEGEISEKLADWEPHLTRIRGLHEESDHSEKYCPLDTEFFTLCHDQPNEFRDRLYDYIVAHEDELVREPVAV